MDEGRNWRLLDKLVGLSMGVTQGDVDPGHTLNTREAVIEKIDSKDVGRAHTPLRLGIYLLARRDDEEELEISRFLYI